MRGFFEVLNVNQCDIAALFEAAEEWDNHKKIKVIIAVGEAGYRFDLRRNSPRDFEIDLYACDTLRDLAIQFVDEGLFGEIPKAIEHYLDDDTIARDLGMDYSETVIAGDRYIYRCG